MLLTLRKLPVIGLSFVHIINSNMRDIHTERSDNFCCLTPNKQCHNFIMSRTSFNSMSCFVLIWAFTVLAHHLAVY
jgi:hypothetical protein